MSQNVVEILLQARDEVSAVLEQTAQKLQDLTPAGEEASRAVSSLSTKASSFAATGGREAASSLSTISKSMTSAVPSAERLSRSILSMAGASAAFGRSTPYVVSGLGGMVSALGAAAKSSDDASEKSRQLSEDVRTAASSASGLNGAVTILDKSMIKITAAAAATGAVFAVVGIAVTSIGIHFAKMAQELQNASTRTGLTVRQLQNLREISEEAGLGATELEVALNHLNREIAEGNPLLEKIGVTSKDAFNALMQLSEAFSSSQNTANKVGVSMVLLGRGSSDLIGVIQNLGETYGKTDTQLETAHRHLSDAALESAKDLRKATKDLGDEWKGLWNTLQQILVPLARLFVVTFDVILKAVVVPGVEFARAVRDNFVQPLLELNKARNEAFPKGVVIPGEAMGQRGDAEQRGVIPILEGTSVSAKRKTSPLDDPNLLKAGNDALEKRKALIKDLGTLLHIYGSEAQRSADAIISMETHSEKLALDKKLRDALEFVKPLAQSLREINGEFDRIASNPEVKLRVKPPPKIEVSEKVPEGPGPQLAPLHAMIVSIDDALNSALDSVNVFSNLMYVTLGGIQLGFESVFLNFTNSAQTLKSSLGAIFRSIRDEILRYLADIVGSAVFKLLFKFIVNVATGGLGGLVGGGMELVSKGEDTIAPRARPSSEEASSTQVTPPRSVRPATVVVPPPVVELPDPVRVAAQSIEVDPSVVVVPPPTIHAPPSVSVESPVVSVSPPKIPDLKISAPRVTVSTIPTVRVPAPRVEVQPVRVPTQPTVRVAPVTVSRDRIVETVRTAQPRTQLLTQPATTASRAPAGPTTREPATSVRRQQPQIIVVMQKVTEASKNTVSLDDRGGNTYNINAMSTRDVIMSLTQPRGELRRASDRVSVVSRY